MAILGIIRKNADSGEYEHFVVTPSDIGKIPGRGNVKTVRVIKSDSEKKIVINNNIVLSGYWAPYIGDIIPNSNYDLYETNDNIITYTNENGETSRRDTNIRSDSFGKKYIIEEITTGKLETIPEKVVYNNNDYIDVIDVSIYELLPVKKGFPIFTRQPTDGLINSKENTNISGFYYNKGGNIVHVENGNYTIYILNGLDLFIETHLKDPVTGALKGLESEWFKDGDSYQRIYNRATSSLAIKSISPADSVNWVCKATNRVGTTDSNRFLISVEKLDDINIFNKNLIKNGDFNSGLSNWDVIEGNPIVSYEWDKMSGDSKNKLLENMFIPDKMVAEMEFPDNIAGIKGPTFSEVLDFNTDFSKQKHQIFHYLTGGVLEENENIICRLRQTIDLSEYSHWVDGKVNGVKGLFGNLFAWMGGAGTIPAFTEANSENNKLGFYGLPSQDLENWNISDEFKNWKPWMVSTIPEVTFADNVIDGRKKLVEIQLDNTMTLQEKLEEIKKLQGNSDNQDNSATKGRYSTYFPHDITIGDRVYVILKMYDFSKNLIETRYRLVNPTHQFNDIRMFLRQQNVYIPHGTRTIDVEIIFEKQYMYNIYDFKKDELKSELILDDVGAGVWYNEWKLIATSENKHSIQDLYNFVIKDSEIIKEFKQDEILYIENDIHNDIKNISNRIGNFVVNDVPTIILQESNLTNNSDVMMQVPKEQTITKPVNTN